LQRRRVFRALVGYGIAAFAILQIIEPVMHGLHWPDEVLSYAVVALAIGFPIVVTLAWIFDVNAGRIERTAPTPAGGPKGIRLGFLLVGIGVLAAAPGTIWYFFVRGKPVSSPAAQIAAITPSIAVLPFADMSPGKDQEYFSDGIAEEILNALAHVDNMRVIGRTSSFSFKGKNDDLRTIGQKLNVGAILEGSVRKAGDQIRITTQLINANDGSHVWSETYDRKLTDMFAVQDEIAKAVVAALKLKLLPAKAAAIDEQRTANPEAHDQYLLGRHFSARGSPEGYGQAVQALEKAVALDPGYAPAWAALSWALFVAADQDPVRYIQEREWPRAQAAAEKAIALAPDLPEGYAARGFLRTNLLNDWAGARADFERGLSLSPGSTDILTWYARLFSVLGRLPEAIAAARKATVLDPLSAESWVQLSNFYLGTGQLDLAEAAAKRALEISSEQGRAARNLGFAWLLAGRYADARAAFQRSNQELHRLMGEALVEHELQHSAGSQRALDELLRKPYAIPASYQIAQVYAWCGEADRAFEWLETAYEHHDPGLGYLKYDPLLRKVRKDPRYAALLAKMKLPPD
jgi:TolB-like protein/Tfp pilus assembly protein PilF